MTLKEELEILRGEPIQVFAGDPMDIPCIETSDLERLCKHPVVSVHMITYNHEPYIRQAIEGVMMQKTDFEFELVIGEDCSTDKTREICFEYQKRYTDKIRVLWCDHNLYQNPHSAGGNSERNFAHCRGEFIAICEGDDYWIDPLKLQKQVQVMREHPNVGFCFCGAKRFFQAANRFDIWDAESHTYKPGVQPNRSFFTLFMLGFPPWMKQSSSCGFIMTATTMVRSNLLLRLHAEFDVFQWRLRLGDATLWLGASSLMDGYFLPDIVSVYRISDSGVFGNAKSRNGVLVDGIIVRLYFFVKVLSFPLREYPLGVFLRLYNMVFESLHSKSTKSRYVIGLFFLHEDACVLSHFCFWPLYLIAVLGIHNRYTACIASKVAEGIISRKKLYPRVLNLYSKLLYDKCKTFDNVK